jgi:GNAT superfamily N-acetyltransferase
VNEKFVIALLLNLDKEVVGFALFYTGYSTWKGRTLYLEDILVTNAQRGNGIGALLFEKVVEIAKERNVKRMDWQVLEWNEPAINFYKKYNATLDPEWLNGRLYF